MRFRSLPMILVLAPLLVVLAHAAPMLSPHTAAPAAARAVQPFGDLKWDDSFSSTVMKIKRWPGIQYCRFVYNGRRIEMGQMSGADQISHVPEAMLGLTTGRLADRYGTIKPPTHKDWATGKEWEYVDAFSTYNAHIEAGPVMIEGAAFAMDINITSEPGAILYMQNNVAKTPGGVLIPIVISSVRLNSHSRALNERSNDIEAKLVSKYGRNGARDTQGDSVIWSAFRESFNISYDSGIPSRLKSLYEDYLNKQAVRENQNKPNLAGGL